MRWTALVSALIQTGLVVVHAKETPPAVSATLPKSESKLAHEFHLSADGARNEKHGHYHNSERIQLFERPLASTSELLIKNPAATDYGVNCFANIKENLEQERKELGHARNVGGPNVFYSAYQVVSMPPNAEDARERKNRKVCDYPASNKPINRRLRRLIREDYKRNLVLPDGLPVMQIEGEVTKLNKIYQRLNQKGLDIGYYTCPDGMESCGNSQLEYYVYNSWQFIFVTKRPLDDPHEGTFDIVRAYAYPTQKRMLLNGKDELPSGKKVSVTFSYRWEEEQGEKAPEIISETSPTTEQKEIVALQWIIGIAVVLLMSFMAAVVLIRTVFKDIRLANKDITEFLVSDEEKIMESGWKLVYADVFRAPANAILFCASIGFGFQLVVTSILTCIVRAAMPTEIKSTSFLGDKTWAFMIYIFAGSFGGFLSARFYKSFAGERWKLNVLLTHVLYPLVLLIPFSIFQITILATKNQNAGGMRASAFFSALAVWIFVGLPLTFLGAFVGFKCKAFEYPVRTNLIPRQIPSQSFSNRLITRAVVGGCLVFMSFFIQFFFISDRLHHKEVNSISLVFATILSTIVCAEIGIISTYKQLIGENYHWWWQSFVIAGFSGVYFFFALWLFFFETGLTTQSRDEDMSDEIVKAVAFFTEGVSLSLCVAVINGFISFVASWFFVRKLYGAVRVD